MTRPRLAVELCAGTAATTRALVGGVRPVSSGDPRYVPIIPAPCGYMGGKTRWAAWHLEAMGLEPGAGADHVLLADGGPWGWVWPVLLDPTMAAEVAAELRSVADEDPRELWEALAAWPVARSVATRAAQWIWLQARAASSVPVWHDGGAWVFCRSERRAGVRPVCQRGLGGREAVGMQYPSVAAARVETIQAAVAWLVLQAGNARGKPVAVRADGAWQTDGYAHLSDLARRRGFTARLQPALLSERVAALEAMSSQSVSVWSGRVEDLHPEGDHSRTVVTIDPPYRGATGYALDLERPSVVGVALRWAACGAAVLVCEAEPVAELVAQGWRTYDVGAFGRSGAKPEWVTMSRPAEPVALARLAQMNREQLALPGLGAA